VDDGDGGHGIDSRAIVVTNLLPVVIIEGAPATCTEGTPINLSSSAFDPGTADTFSFAWSVLKNGSPFAAGSGGTFNFVPDNNGLYVVSLLLTDDDGGMGSATASITVDNVAPSVTLNGPASALEGQSRHYSFTANDPGADVLNVVATSGGSTGIVSNLVFDATTRAGSFDVTFLDGPALSVVSVQVSDSDGALSIPAILAVTVNNAAPTVAISGPASATEGQTEHYTFTTADAGVDTFQVVAASGGALGTVSNLVFDATTGAGSFDVTFVEGPALSPVSIQVQDSDGLLSNVATIFVTVNNAPPTATILGPSTAPEGTVISLTSAVGDPGVLDSVTYLWSVRKAGQPTPYATGTSASLSFTPDDNAVYTVSLTVIDDDGASVTATKTIEVTNAPPSGTLSPGGFVFEGSPAVLSFTSSFDQSPADASSLHFFFATSAAARDAGAYATSSPQPVSPPFTFANNGSFTVYARVLDKDGGHADYQTTVTVRNVAPIFSPPAAQQGVQGIASSFNVGSFADPGADSPWNVIVDWGDAGPLPIFQATAAGQLTAQSHIYAALGSYNVTVTVVDKDGESHSGTFAVAVVPPAPTLTPPADQSAQEGISTLFNLGSFQDLAPPPAGGWSGTVHWGDGTQDPISVTSVGSLPARHHTYADNGVYTVTVQLTGAGGLPGHSTFIVTVANVAPEIFGLGNSSPEGSDVLPGQTVTITASFEDLGTADTHSALIDWGDGSTSAGTIVEYAGLGTVTGSHAYAAGGIYVVRLTLTDDDGEFSIDVTTSIIAGVGLHNRQLQIIGTTGRDLAVVPRLGDSLLVFTLLGLASSPTDDANCGENFDEDWSNYFQYYALRTFRTADVDSILVKGYAGNDHVYIGQSVTQPAIIDGGAGNDWLHGGGGNDTITDLSGNNRVFGGGANDTINTGGGNDNINAGSGNDAVLAGGGTDYVIAGTGNDIVDAGDGHDIILGGDGGDVLRGGTGRDLIIGGNGADLILGNGDEDILIAGTTDYDANEAALLAIMDEWTSSRTYLQRIHNLSQGTAEKSGLDSTKFNSRSNGNYYLIGNDGGRQTVFNDNDVDTLTGEIDSTDWYLANKTADNGGAIDIITDKALGEIFSDTDF
jgi:PKD repeat protein